MKFTILGGRGVIGQALTAKLLADGHQVSALGRGDSWDTGSGWGHVVFAAGLTADFRSRPLDTVEAHVGVLVDVLRRGCFDSLLYLSSTRVYVNAVSTDEAAALSIRPADPSDLYNLSKLLGESLCLGQHEATVRVARLSNVVGGHDAATENFIPSLVREARAGCIVLRSSLTSAKDYIHIADVVDLLPRIAQGGQHRLYNVASGVNVSHGEWADRLRAIYGCDVRTVEGAPELRFAPIDVRRIREEFAFVPRAALEALDLPSLTSDPRS